MAKAPTPPDPIEGPDPLQPAFNIAAQMVDGFFQAQRMQIDALSRWQQTLAPAFKFGPFPDWMSLQLEFLKRAQKQADDMRDAWVSHWAGGVPIDA
jgi:hypothetical protein